MCVDIVITNENASNEMVIVVHHRITTTVGIEIEITVIETETETEKEIGIGIEEASIREGNRYDFLLFVFSYF